MMRVGFGQKEITPETGPVIIAGRIPWRRTAKVDHPIYAVAMVLESGGERIYWVCCDICHPTKRVFDETAEILGKRISGFTPDRLIFSATHAKGCFYLTDDELLGAGYDIDLNAIEPLEQTRLTVCRGAAEAVLEAVESMEECTCSFGSADILTGFCRRVVYRDGSAVMYGDVHREDFQRMEYPDGGPSQFLYFYRVHDGSLKGIFANIPCPAQTEEGTEAISPDYWRVVRQWTEEAYGCDVKVLGTCRAAGELSPRKMITNETTDVKYIREEDVVHLGSHIAKGMIYSEEHPERIYGADLELEFISCQMEFPVRQPTKEEYETAVAYHEEPSNFDGQGAAVDCNARILHAHNQRIWERQVKTYRAKVTALKLGELLFFTAPAELFAEYAHRIAMRFPGHPVLDVQLSDDSLGYMPTKEAIEHGGYSATIFSTVTDEQGGEVYVAGVISMLQKLLET